MQEKELIRQLNERIPRPDPVIAEALYRFDREAWSRSRAICPAPCPPWPLMRGM